MGFSGIMDADLISKPGHNSQIAVLVLISLDCGNNRQRFGNCTHKQVSETMDFQIRRTG